MISYEQKEKKFNFRVGGILESPDRKKIFLYIDFQILTSGYYQEVE